MTTNEKTIDSLLTGSEATDSLLRKAYELGLQNGKIIDRSQLQRSARIDSACQLLRSLMCTQNTDLQTAMVMLRIPRAERKTYVKIFAAREKRK